MNSRNLALIAAFLTAVIYGVSFTVAKEVMPKYVQPYGFITLRVFGAMLLFWFSSLFVKHQKIDRPDFFRIIAAAFFGVALNMLTFFKGLSYTTPITAAAIMVTSPILVMLLASILLKEKLRKQKILGVLIGMIGAIVLISYGHEISANSNAIFGDFLVFVNAASYAMYLVIVKKLTQKYNPFNFVKWLYTFGFLMVLPFGFQEVVDIRWDLIPELSLWKIAFIVVFTTFVTYLFNLLALTKLKPTTVSIFMYLQPVIATIYALYVGSDSLNLIKVVATLSIFLGVYLVTKPVKN
ncbi:DMT family transporter [Aureivirga marina]|uniref:DMT family transporter n=1 Tax=Aureivirga marina TaxID=1182451 RepID=UPI0018CA2CBE|nr:DMT family transporter [Aureivirga marina]